MKEKKPNILKVVYIRKDQILADISAQIQIVAESRPLPNGTQMPILQNATERFETQFDRWIDKYIDLAKARMAAYFIELHRKSAMNAKRKWDEAELRLSFPWYWNETTFPELADAIHDYIVNACAYEFFVLSLTSKDAVTIDKLQMMDDAYSMIKHCCVSSKPGTQQKKLHPFY